MSKRRYRGNKPIFRDKTVEELEGEVGELIKDRMRQIMKEEIQSVPKEKRRAVAIEHLKIVLEYLQSDMTGEVQQAKSDAIQAQFSLTKMQSKCYRLVMSDMMSQLSVEREPATSPETPNVVAPSEIRTVLLYETGIYLFKDQVVTQVVKTMTAVSTMTTMAWARPRIGPIIEPMIRRGEPKQRIDKVIEDAIEHELWTGLKECYPNATIVPPLGDSELLLLNRVSEMKFELGLMPNPKGGLGIALVEKEKPDNPPSQY